MCSKDECIDALKAQQMNIFLQNVPNTWFGPKSEAAGGQSGLKMEK